MLTRIASYNELQTLGLALHSILKLSITTGAILALPLVGWAAQKLRPEEKPGEDLCWNLGRDVEAKSERRAA